MPMNVSESLSGAKFVAALSSLSTANRQPQLALDLIMKSLPAAEVTGAALSSPPPDTQTVAPLSSSGDSGSVINIFA